MAAFQFKHVRIESYAYCVPPQKITSSELENQMAAIYDRLQIPFGTLEKLTGIESRYFYDSSTKPSTAATEAGKMALDKMKFGREKIGAIFNCSVTRDNFEPATACVVHANLGLGKNAFALDLSNACVGFSNGLVTLASMIECGAIEAGLIVSGENGKYLVEDTLNCLNSRKDITKTELLNFLPVFTLGSAAVAMVLCHERIASTSHQLLGSVMQTSSELHDLCVGNGDHAHALVASGQKMLMTTQANKLISSAASLSKENWQQFSAKFGWKKEEIDHLIAHQVGKKGNGNEQFFKTFDIDLKKEFSVYKRFGNTASCALPKTLMIAADEQRFKEKDKILLAGYGSGLNTIFSGVIW